MQTKLIVALDFDNRVDALMLIDKLNPTDCALKVGNELFVLLGSDFVRELVQRQFKVFLDLKFHDIPNTVSRAIKAAASLGVWMLNVHASGGLDMMVAAKKAINELEKPPLLIAVTVLTSLSEAALASTGVKMSLQETALHLAKMAQEAGLDGVVCSAAEVAMIKAHCGRDFLTVTPGIRFESNASDDQVRTVTPEQALSVGCDYLVVGRPITRAENPKQVVQKILKLTADLTRRKNAPFN